MSCARIAALLMVLPLGGALADVCSQVVPGASMAYYQGRYGSAGGDGYCHARTGNEANTNASVNSQAGCANTTGNLFVEFSRDGGKNFNDCIFRPPTDGGAQPAPPPPPPPPAPPTAKPPPPPVSKATYTIRVCNKGGAGDAWIAHQFYPQATSEVLQVKGWWRVPAGECATTLTLPFGNHGRRSVWTFAQFDKSPMFWPKQALDPVGRGLDQYSWCIPLPPRDFAREIVQRVGYPCANDWRRFFQESEAVRASSGNTPVSVDVAPLSTEVPFRLRVCNKTGEAELWAVVGLPTGQSPTEPFLRGWAKIPRDGCVTWPGYRYPNHRGWAYVYAEVVHGPGRVTVYKMGEGPIDYCVGQDHDEVNRVNAEGYRCSGDERALGFYRIGMPHDFPDTLTTVNVGGNITIGE